MYVEIENDLKFKWESVGHHQLGIIAQEIIHKTGNNRIITLSGDLGAGKTTLVKAMCTTLGVVDMVSSPTYSIINEYRTKSGQSVYHFDCYRINLVKQLNEIGADEYLYSGNYCFIEWPEIMQPLLTERYVQLTLSVNGNERDIEMRIIR